MEFTRVKQGKYIILLVNFIGEGAKVKKLLGFIIMFIFSLYLFMETVSSSGMGSPGGNKGVILYILLTIAIIGPIGLVSYKRKMR